MYLITASPTPPPPPNLAVWNHCKTPFYSLHYNLSPQVRLLDMDAQKAAQYCEIFPLWRCCQPWNATFSVNPVYVYGFSRSHLWVQCNWWIDFDRLVIRNRELKKTTTVTRMPPKSVERRLCTCVINRTFLSRPPHSNVIWLSSVYLGKCERRRKSFHIFVCNWTLALLASSENDGHSEQILIIAKFQEKI